MIGESKIAGMHRKGEPPIGRGGTQFFIGNESWWLDESPEAIVEATYEDERLRLAKLIDSRGDEIERLTAENEQLKRQRDELIENFKSLLSNNFELETIREELHKIVIAIEQGETK